MERPEPRREAAGQVILRTLEVGVCGTDREIAAFEYGTPPPGEEALIIGHEALAEVVDADPKLTGIGPGDLVVPMVRRPCVRPDCRACRAGRQDFCSTGEYRERGIKEAHGFMTELFVEDARYLNAVPSTLRDVAVLVEPLTIAEKALAEISHIQRRLPWLAADPEAGTVTGSRALVLGAGPVALLGAMLLRLRGYDTYVYSRSATPNPKSQVAEAVGARYLSSDDLPPTDIVGELGPMDVVYEAVGAAWIAFEVLAALGRNGVFAFTGVPPLTGEVTVDGERVMRDLVLGNKVALGSVNAPDEAFVAAIADLAEFRRRWPDPVRALISARHPIDAVADLLRERPSGIKHVVTLAEFGNGGP